MTMQNKSVYLKGKLLLSMPTMSDPRFHKSVILICQHDENGAMGIAINNVLPTLRLGPLLGQFDIDVCDEAKDKLFSTHVYSGGPVDSERGFLVHSPNFVTRETIGLGKAGSVSTTLAALKSVARNQGPENYKFILGYAGWEAGQLEQEIQDNSWMITNSTQELLFHTPEEMIWDQAMAMIGVSPSMLSHTAGHA